MQAQLTGFRPSRGRCAARSFVVALAAMSVVVAGQERPLHRITIPALITGIAFAPDGETLVAWDPGGWSRWDAASGRQREREMAIARACEGVSVLPRSEDGRVMGAQCRDRLLFFEIATARQLGERRLPEKQTAAVYTASPDGKAMAVVMAGATDTVRIGDLSGDAETSVRIGSEIEQLAFDSTGTRLTVGSWRGVEVRQAPDGTLLRTLAGRAAHALSADGRTVAVLGDGGARVFDVESGEMRREVEGRVAHLRFSPGGRLLVGWTNQRVIVWDIAAGAQRLVLTGDEFVGAAVSPDGHQLATVSLERRGERATSTVAVWRLPAP